MVKSPIVEANTPFRRTPYATVATTAQSLVKFTMLKTTPQPQSFTAETHLSKGTRRHGYYDTGAVVRLITHRQQYHSTLGTIVLLLYLIHGTTV